MRRSQFPLVALGALCSLAPFAVPAPAAAQNLDLPTVPLPSGEPTGPSLWFSAADVPALKVRRTSATVGAAYAATRAYVDARLASLATNPASLNDDSLTQFAKGAALLQALGEVPAATFSSYRDAAVAALKRVGTRSGATIPLNPNPPDEIDPLQDSPRLQSMAEAYDLLRGSGVPGADDAAIRARIDQWAQAMHDDLNLAGVLGVGGHRDNWGIKGGSALITCALALSAHPHAAGWMTFGNTLVHDSLAVTGSSAGWYRESAHYLNYALDDAFSTAVHVQRRTGVDWLSALEPFARAALDTRQPDGSAAPFEEGVISVFPFDVFAARSAALGGQLAWAWSHSTKDTGSWANQQLAPATQFLAGELPAEVAPAGRPSRFVEGDAHLSALRTDFGPLAVQATLFNARDYSASTLVASRHNMQNPLDLVVAGLGQLLLPTSGGGPTVTTSSNRSYYLTPAARNLVLVNGSAPFVTDGGQLSVDSRLAGQDEGGLSGRYLELVRAQVTGAYPAPVSAVSRTVALLGGSFIAVVDEVAASSSASVSMPFHGRGVRGAASGTSPVKTGWTQQGVALDYAAVAAQPLSVTAVAGHTTLGFGHEEAIDGITVNATGAQVRVLSLFSVRAATSTAASVEDRSAGDALALRVTAGAVVDHLSSAARGSPTSVDGAVTDASFSALREESGALTAFAFSAATRLTWGGAALLQSDRPLTASVSLHPAGLLAELSPDQAGASSFKLGGLALAAGVGVRGFFNGVALTSAALHADAGGVTLDNLAKGGTLRVEAGARLLDAVPPQTVSEGSALTFTLAGTAPAGGALTFSMSVNVPLPASNLPALDPQTGVFSWTPGASIASHTGPRDLVFTFFAESDGFIAAQPCQIRVLDVNQPPSVQTPAAQSVQRGGTLKMAIAGTDPDGDALTWSFTSTPALASPGPVLGAATGALDWTAPLDAPLGTFSLTITASDGALTATAPLALTVLPAAPAPVARSGCGGCAGGAGGLQVVLLLALWWPERRRQPRARREELHRAVLSLRARAGLRAVDLGPGGPKRS